MPTKSSPPPPPPSTTSSQPPSTSTLETLISKHLPSPPWHEIPTLSFQAHTTTTENSLLTHTLAHPTGVLAMRTHVHRPTPSPAVTEACLVFSLGSGVNGIKDTCHGGMIGLMLDEATGTLASELFGRYHIITAGLDVRYRRRLATPCTVFVGARVAPEEQGDRRRNGGRRRKVVVEGEVRDVHGVVYATGRAVFVRIEAGGEKGKL